ncbi:MAG: hypothetical protein AAGA42_02435 [Actinomycetota bacterium]
MSGYRIALRPDDRSADPLDCRTRLDDIVVKDVVLFRAEQLDASTWWVCCYLGPDGDDRITWTVRAAARPKRLDWTGYEYPEGDVVYEHQVVERARARREFYAGLWSLERPEGEE